MTKLKEGNNSSRARKLRDKCVQTKIEENSASESEVSSFHPK